MKVSQQGKKNKITVFQKMHFNTSVRLNRLRKEFGGGCCIRVMKCGIAFTEGDEYVTIALVCSSDSSVVALFVKFLSRKA